uniref:Armadillo repeat-containing domain-containing protein n=1 Tax=Leersia perrieri TaxID=77586 RepID=A0A0D9WK06_9ORYZ
MHHHKFTTPKTPSALHVTQNHPKSNATFPPKPPCVRAPPSPRETLTTAPALVRLRRLDVHVHRRTTRALRNSTCDRSIDRSAEYMGEARDDEAARMMRAAVKRLSFGTAEEERAEAAAEVRRLARSDERTKRLLPELGVVPPLVSMLADVKNFPGARITAAGALLELARGAHRNKVHIVQAGFLKKLPLLMEDKNMSRSNELALLLLSISSLANTDFPIAASDLLPFLVAVLRADDAPADTKLTCLAALHNLSTKIEHVRAVASSGAARALVALSTLAAADDGTTSEVALSVLGDLAAASGAARREIEDDEAAAAAIVDAMARHDAPRHQELAAYLAMVLAHNGGGGGGGRILLRRRMRRLGVVQVLLEVSLLGTPLAARRAAKILQWFKDGDGRSRITAHSGPRMEGGGADDDGDGEEDGEKDCRKGVERIVKQSLDRNMKSIMRRATASVDLTNVKLLDGSSSSKSLPC